MDFFGRTYEIKEWTHENLGRIVVIDTETEVAPFYTTPKVATIQVYNGGSNVYFVPPQRISLFINKHYDSILVMHNAPFDVDVLCKEVGRSDLLDSHYRRNLIRDTGVLYRLYHLADIGYVPKRWSLGLLAKQFLGIELDKDGEERVSFAQYIGKSFDSISREHKEYAAKDAIVTFLVYQKLMSLVIPHDEQNTLLSQDIQVKGDLALLHIHKNGIGFDLARRDEWLLGIDRLLQVETDKLATWGWCRGMKGINDRYERICQFLGIDTLLPRTADGSLSSKEDDLKNFSHLPFISSYLKFNELEKAASFVRDINTSVLYPRYNLLMNTGRTSCTGPNVQQLPRAGGIREMFIPREKDHVFIDVDYAALELATLAQICYSKFGKSIMRDKINEGQCLHYYTASYVYNKKESEVTKDERQFAKIPNFGFAANMAPATFIEYCKNYGISISEQRAKETKDAWLTAYPEMNQFFNIGNQSSVFTLTGRKRSDARYTAYLNTQFQGLASDGLKLALFELDRQGFEIAAEIHDQVVVSVHKDEAKEKLPLVQKIMEESMQIVCPDVTIRTEGNIIERFTK
jgi:DNA polymerase I-like protein with 3'-5' exonuclease and polymerase domains